MQPVVVRGFAELRDAGITRTGYELYGLLFVYNLGLICICECVKSIDARRPDNDRLTSERVKVFVSNQVM